MRFDRVTLRLGGIQRERYLTKVKFSSIFIRTDEFVYIYIYIPNRYVNLFDISIEELQTRWKKNFFSRNLMNIFSFSLSLCFDILW